MTQNTNETTWAQRAIETATRHAVDFAEIESHYLSDPAYFRALRAERNRGERALEKLRRRNDRRVRGW